MAKKETVLITGAAGEVAHALIPVLAENFNCRIIALDIKSPEKSLKPFISKSIRGSVTNESLLESAVKNEKVTSIFHLAAVLSTSAEKDPEGAHKVNVGGTFNLLNIANKYAQKLERPLKFIFPSTIAVYGLPDVKTKGRVGKVEEGEFNNPITIYGVNKLYCENLGIYYFKHYSLLNPKRNPSIDFRCVRFPGLISALTLPSGGTSDYAPEMIHAAAKGKNYSCFVRKDTTIPFMAMADAAEVLLEIYKVKGSMLKRRVYNVSGFSASAKDIENKVKEAFPKTVVNYETDLARQKIVDSWPEEVDDSNAIKDWGWKPKFDFDKTFSDYLIPSISERYT
jgi:nucleoside-diphosphate-sugar epimerase